MKIKVLIGVLVLGSAIGAYFVADTLVDRRFPTADTTVAEINARPDVLANTRQAFLSEGPANSVPFRVLFYGQSITEGVWPEKVVEAWSQRYPQLAIDYTNRAIGGFGAPHLKRTIEADLADISPDLVVFHVYGGHHPYTETVDALRRMTGADVILQTDHATVWPAEKCDIGLFVIPGKQPGCKGAMLRQQRGWNEYMSYHYIPSLAEEYDFAVEPRLERWTATLDERDLEPKDLLIDDVHLNEAGEQVMAEHLIRFVDEIVHDGSDPVASRRVLVEAPAQTDNGGFDLNISGAYRVEAVGPAVLPAKGLAQIDGQAVESLETCFAHGRPSKMTEELVWPAVRQIGSASPLVEERWTARVENISPDGTEFSFSVEGEKTGLDGSGSSGQDFTSSSGRVVIKANDWMLAEAIKIHKIDVGDALSVTWDARYLCDDAVAIETNDGVKQFRTIATGLDGESDTITLNLAPEQLAEIEHFLLTPSRLQ